MIQDNLIMILGMFIVTYFARAAPFIFSHICMSPLTLRVLEKVPAAVLAALIAEPVLNPTVEAGHVLLPELLAAFICLLVGLSGASLLITVLVGMSSYWLMSIFF